MLNPAPYGTWDSPIAAEWVTASQKRFDQVWIDGNEIYWEELRPSEGGKTFVVRRSPDGKLTDLNPPNSSVRTRVHEYGGGSYTVHQGKFYFVQDKDQRIYVNGKPLTEAGVRFANLRGFSSGLIAVGEKGTENFLASIDSSTGKYTVIASGHDFYAAPTLSPDGSKIAFLTWDHPQMPWDGTDLWISNLNGTELTHVAGGKTESIFQPEWSPDGILYYVSDRTSWWNLYKTPAEALCPKEAEFGLPSWVFGMSTYGFTGSEIIAIVSEKDREYLAFLPPLKPLELPWSDFSQLRTGNGFAVFIASSPTSPKAVVRYDFKTSKCEVLAHNFKPQIDNAYFSVPQFIEFPSKGGRKAYGYFYPPANKDFCGTPGELPPLIVKSHGGPTSAASEAFDLKVQYWTSRGFAILDVDYGGSTGYGRAYRNSLKGKWGIVDVEDCEAGAQYLVAAGKVDPKRMAITGGSAGGFTTLAALAFGKTFTVGASYYGVSSLEDLAEETHKFEARYLDGLVAPYPEGIDVYRARSPLHAVDHLHCPVIFFQGGEDKVVPLAQAEKMYEALKNRGILTELVIYPEEQHGFRRAENIRDALEKERKFYLKAWKMMH